jgi:primosomal protein N' (replication factor Y)
MDEALFDIPNAHSLYASVLLPLAVGKPYTYSVPDELRDKVAVGCRVEVTFGKGRAYAAIVRELHGQPPLGYRPKPILSLIDEAPIITEVHLSFWEWLSNYYCCTIGEVVAAALPSGLKLSSETILSFNQTADGNFEALSDKEFLVAEALHLQHELKLSDVQAILGQKMVYPIVKSLLEKNILFIKEELQTAYKPKTISCLRLQEPYRSEASLLGEAFKKLGRADRQMEALMAFVQLSRSAPFVRKQAVMDAAKASSAIIKALEDKGILETYQREVSRLGGYEDELQDNVALSPQQLAAFQQILAAWERKNVALLNGVTGSGKTQVYIELIQQAIDEGKQVLYLLPEIALTAQIIERLKRVFGDQVVAYHSKMNDNERVEVWKSAMNGKPLILAARSGLFLPFANLQYIIIDEEHDPSYKQFDPAPRYHARDAAIYLAHLLGAKVLLGTATPSIESFYNAKTGKYALVEMTERYGGMEMPHILLADVQQEAKKRQMQSHFSNTLLQHLSDALGKGEQAILFQNRRGYSPVLHCQTCDWHAECLHCDVSLTYHKQHNKLRCHYCGYGTEVPKECPACGNAKLTLKGFGTEKIEDELKIYLPSAKIGRMDWDTVQTKNAHASIINDFEERRLDILVGTQMVTKGLDFDNVGVVGILSADSLLRFPDFRASERAFQLMTQVSGRAGRKNKRGTVIIQVADVSNPTVQEVLHSNAPSFYERELTERRDFNYPPFSRLIKITLKHKSPQVVFDASKLVAEHLKKTLGERLIGPAVPGVPRVRSYYLMDMMLKLERDASMLQLAKQTIAEAEAALFSTKGFSQVRFLVDADPY